MTRTQLAHLNMLMEGLKAAEDIAMLIREKILAYIKDPK